MSFADYVAQAVPGFTFWDPATEWLAAQSAPQDAELGGNIPYVPAFSENWMRGLRSLPGSERFFVNQGYDENIGAGSENMLRFDPSRFTQYLADNRYRIGEGSVGGGEDWVHGIFDSAGNAVIPVEQGTRDDSNFWTAGQIAMAITGANISAANAANAANASGGASGSLGADGISSFYGPPGSESAASQAGSTGAATGASGSAANYNALDDFLTTGTTDYGAGGIYVDGSSGIPSVMDYVAEPSIANYNPSAAPVDISGGSVLTNPQLTGAAMPSMNGINASSASGSGFDTPTLDAPQQTTAPPPQSPGNQILDWIQNNPIDAANIGLGLVGSAVGGGGGGSGSGIAGMDQSGLTAQQAPAFRRQYVAPPSGYRPGFDPEHKFFTGIGTVGTGPG